MKGEILLKKKLFVKQRDTRDCGPCCLLSILRYYEGNVNLEKIRLDTKINNNGTTAFNIIMAARKYGLDGYGKKISILDNDLKLPVIAHILTKRGYEHFVVIYKIKKDKIIVMDPAEGFKRVRLSDFEKEWDGIILVLRPYKRIIHEHFNGGFINSVLSIIGQEKELFCKLLFDSIGIALLSLILAMYWQFAFSNGDHLDAGIYADSDLIRIAGVSFGKVQNFDLQVLSSLCEIRGHSVFAGCQGLINGVGAQMNLHAGNHPLVIVHDVESVGSNLFSAVIVTH